MNGGRWGIIPWIQYVPLDVLRETQNADIQGTLHHPRGSFSPASH